MKKTKITSRDRLCDALGVTLKDIIVKDLLSDSDTDLYYDSRKASLLRKMNIYIDKEEGEQDVAFNLSIDDKPAFEKCKTFKMYLLSGKNNETGADPIAIDGNILTEEPDTIVAFRMPVNNKDTFSYHKDGYSYANYVIYGISDRTTKIILSKGKIYMTDILFDLTETEIDGQ